MKPMIKAAIASVCLIAICASTAVAQTPELQSAIDEGIRREAYKLELHKKLADAQAAQKKGNNFEAARLYTDCVGLIKKIGVGVEAEQKQLVTGIVPVRLQLAEQAQRSGDFANADLHAVAI